MSPLEAAPPVSAGLRIFSASARRPNSLNGFAKGRATSRRTGTGDAAAGHDEAALRPGGRLQFDVDLQLQPLLLPCDDLYRGAADGVSQSAPSVIATNPCSVPFRDSTGRARAARIVGRVGPGRSAAAAGRVSGHWPARPAAIRETRQATSGIVRWPSPDRDRSCDRSTRRIA